MNTIQRDTQVAQVAYSDNDRRLSDFMIKYKMHDF